MMIGLVLGKFPLFFVIVLFQGFVKVFQCFFRAASGAGDKGSGPFFAKLPPWSGNLGSFLRIGGSRHSKARQYSGGLGHHHEQGHRRPAPLKRETHGCLRRVTDSQGVEPAFAEPALEDGF